VTWIWVEPGQRLSTGTSKTDETSSQRSVTKKFSSQSGESEGEKVKELGSESKREISVRGRRGFAACDVNKFGNLGYVGEGQLEVRAGWMRDREKGRRSGDSEALIGLGIIRGGMGRGESRGKKEEEQTEPGYKAPSRTHDGSRAEKHRRWQTEEWKVPPEGRPRNSNQSAP
jgi:hypothetical protein